MTYSSILAMGFSVEKEELITEKELGRKCPQKHPDQKNIFCSICGSKLIIEKQSTPTNQVLKLMELNEWDKNWFDLELIPMLIKIDHKDQFFIGMELSAHQGTDVVEQFSDTELASFRSDVERLRELFGVGCDRPIRLIHYSYYC